MHCHLVGGTDFLVVDDRVADEVICPASCATATVASAMRFAGNITDASVVILGAGMLGLTAAAMARSLNAESVTVCDVDTNRLKLAQRFGCDTAVQFNDVSGPFDVVLEMSGSAAATQASLRLAGIGGTIVLVGAVLPTAAISVDPEQVVRRLLSIRGVHNYAPQDLVTAADFLAEFGDKFPFAELVDRSFPLSQVNEAIEYAEALKPIRIAVRPTT